MPLTAQWLQGQWQKKLGLLVKIVAHEPREYWPFLSKVRPDLFLAGFTSFDSDGLSYLQEFDLHNESNWIDLDLPEYTKGLALAHKETKPEKRQKILRELQRLL